MGRRSKMGGQSSGSPRKEYSLFPKDVDGTPINGMKFLIGWFAYIIVLIIIGSLAH